MNIKELTTLAKKITAAYAQSNRKNGHKTWTVEQYMSGFVGDVGDLQKLIMAKQNYRHKDDIDEKLAHELADCLWSLLVISDELDINLEEAYRQNMTQLLQRVKDL